MCSFIVNVLNCPRYSQCSSLLHTFAVIDRYSGQIAPIKVYYQIARIIDNLNCISLFLKELFHFVTTRKALIYCRRNYIFHVGSGSASPSLFRQQNQIPCNYFLCCLRRPFLNTFFPIYIEMYSSRMYWLLTDDGVRIDARYLHGKRSRSLLLHSRFDLIVASGWRSLISSMLEREATGVVAAGIDRGRGLQGCHHSNATLLAYIDRSPPASKIHPLCRGRLSKNEINPALGPRGAEPVSVSPSAE